jgi:hypothetical protein
MGNGPCLLRFAAFRGASVVAADFLLFVSGSGWWFEFVGAAIGDDFFS